MARRPAWGQRGFPARRASRGVHARTRLPLARHVRQFRSGSRARELRTGFLAFSATMAIGVGTIVWATKRVPDGPLVGWWRHTWSSVDPSSLERERAYLEVRVSTIAGAGKGLYTKRAIRKGETICEYSGDVLTLLQYLGHEDTSYTLTLSTNAYVDALHSDTHARYINDNADPTALNARWRKMPREGKALVVATRDIGPNEEIFISYGENYWSLRPGVKKIGGRR